MKKFCFLLLISAFVLIKANAQISLVALMPDTLQIGKSYSIEITIDKDGLLTNTVLAIPYDNSLKIDSIVSQGNVYKYPNLLYISFVKLKPEQDLLADFRLKIKDDKNLPNELNIKFILSYLINGNKGEIINSFRYKLIESDEVKMYVLELQ